MLMTAENRFIRSNGSPQQQQQDNRQLRRPSPDNNNQKKANTPPKSQATTNITTNATTTNTTNTTTNKAKPIDDQYYDSTRVYLAPIPQFHYYATNPPKALATNTNTKPQQQHNQFLAANNQQHFNDENYSLDNNQQQPQLVPPPLEASNNNNNNYNASNNFHSSQQHLGAPPFDIENYYMTPTNDSDIMMNTDDVTYHIAQQIEIALHQARTTFLNCCQVSIPCKLTLLIAQDIVQMSESEPCGLRGCTLFINLEEKDFCQRIATCKFADPFSVATFEMYLTLKRVTPGWLNEVSNRILKNFGRNSIAISDLYRLSKKKLYRTASNQF